VFKGVDPDILSIAFSLPIFAFVAGCWFRREQVRAVVAHPAIRSERRMLGAFPHLHRRRRRAAAVARGGTARQHGRSADRRHDADRADRVHREPRRRRLPGRCRPAVFEEFFFRIQRLVVPAFAFLTFYSLLIILFASAYHILSQYTGRPHFYVGGSPQVLSFSESIYFSIVSISTVGYGDIVPHSSVARLLASIEVVCGFMLLLFGVSELLEYTRERREEDGKPRRPPRR
jgi:voltage-gated potassium channel